ncbi:uncharacterized protein LOC142980738 [Anticarsia gemmatalis]|uniref:uncharacterized protein LOC142980738 n=1 Tax=Anticarsia gemmatalis TaxID=129554 RepID=UPI003F764877
MNHLFITMFTLVIFALYSTVTSKRYDNGESVIRKKFKMPESCKGSELCFSNENYPYSEVKSALRKLDKDIEQDYNKISARNGCSANADCPCETMYDLIYYIIDETGAERVVIQQPGKFIQRFEMRKCKHQGQIQKTERLVTPNLVGRNLTSETVYLNVDFFVLSAPKLMGDFAIERVGARIPVCCACRLH